MHTDRYMILNIIILIYAAFIMHIYIYCFSYHMIPYHMIL